MSAEHYTGSCQCGAVTFEVDVDLDSTMTCNCSRCQRLGAVLAFAPKAAFALVSGETALTEFTFNKRKIHHQFCRVCGIEPFAYGEMSDGTAMVAVNANCLEGVDPRTLKSKHVDGRSF